MIEGRDRVFVQKIKIEEMKINFRNLSMKLQIRKLEYLLELIKLKVTSLRNSSLELIINNKIIYKELFWSVEIQKKKKLIGWNKVSNKVR